MFTSGHTRWKQLEWFTCVFKALFVHTYTPAAMVCAQTQQLLQSISQPEACLLTLYLGYTRSKCPYRQGTCLTAPGFHGTPWVTAALHLLPVPTASCSGMSRISHSWDPAPTSFSPGADEDTAQQGMLAAARVPSPGPLRCDQPSIEMSEPVSREIPFRDLWGSL